MNYAHTFPYCFPCVLGVLCYRTWGWVVPHCETCLLFCTLAPLGVPLALQMKTPLASLPAASPAGPDEGCQSSECSVLGRKRRDAVWIWGPAHCCLSHVGLRGTFLDSIWAGVNVIQPWAPPLHSPSRKAIFASWSEFHWGWILGAPGLSCISKGILLSTPGLMETLAWQREGSCQPKGTAWRGDLREVEGSSWGVRVSRAPLWLTPQFCPAGIIFAMYPRIY